MEEKEASCPGVVLRQGCAVSCTWRQWGRAWDGSWVGNEGKELPGCFWLQKSNGEAAVAPVPTKHIKPLGSPASAVGERLLQRESPSFWKEKDRKGGVQLEQTA